MARNRPAVTRPKRNTMRDIRQSDAYGPHMWPRTLSVSAVVDGHLGRGTALF
jgi:hypothetical protein